MFIYARSNLKNLW